MSTIAEFPRKDLVFMIDDNSGDLLLMQHAFARSGVPVDIATATSAEEALLCLKQGGRQDSFFRPDLILCDLSLPRMNGERFVKALRADADFGDIPVVILSNSSMPSDVDRCREAGANGYFTKPMALSEYDGLIAALETGWLSTGRAVVDTDLTGVLPGAFSGCLPLQRAPFLSRIAGL